MTAGDDGATPTEILQRLGAPFDETVAYSTPASLPPVPDSESRAEERFGRYQVVGPLGEGGMGRVVEAFDPELRRRVAIKIIKDAMRRDPAALARFVAEAQVTSQLGHPNIVPVHDIGATSEGGIWFAMKKVEGRSLRQVLQDLRAGTVTQWTLHRLLTVFGKICQAVASAHDQGVLHRDLKPSNIMLGRYGEVLVLDWGVAALLGRSVAVPEVPIERMEFDKTIDGAVVGTPGYMSPEQARGKVDRLTPAADVWSLGSILYELLTLERAYEGTGVFAPLFQAAAGPPRDPRKRAPARDIPEDAAALCLRALAPEPSDRFTTAGALAEEVDALLEGSKRREAARAHLKQASAAWERYQGLAGEREGLLSREADLDDSIPPWASLEAKGELLKVRRRLSAVGGDRVDRFEEVVFACEQALSQDPGNGQAHALLAEVHYARFEEAEAARDEDGRRHHERRVRRYDTGRYATLLEGVGSLTLRTDPPGAEVICERYDTEAPLDQPLIERRALGVTPLVRVPLEQGSYRLTLRSPGKRDTLYPVFISRGREWDSGERPVPLYADEVIGAGLVYVPPGPFLCGGDEHAAEALSRSEPWVEGFFLSTLPLTMAGYCDFINALTQRDPTQAWARVPRQESGLSGAGRRYWTRPPTGGEYRVPEVDSDGDRWDENWPVNSVSWEDAVACAEWMAERDGLPWTLPTEQQWEKAARGCDGRIFPWGRGFDPTLCKMRDSREARPQPEIVGAFPADVSPFGVRDLAGGIRDWCGDPSYGGDPQRHPVRGGSWNTSGRFCRTAHRSGGAPSTLYSSVGFRLARAAPQS